MIMKYFQLFKYWSRYKGYYL